MDSDAAFLGCAKWLPCWEQNQRPPINILIYCSRKRKIPNINSKGDNLISPRHLEIYYLNPVMSFLQVSSLGTS